MPGGKTSATKHLYRVHYSDPERQADLDDTRRHETALRLLRECLGEMRSAAEECGGQSSLADEVEMFLSKEEGE